MQCLLSEGAHQKNASSKHFSGTEGKNRRPNVNKSNGEETNQVEETEKEFYCSSENTEEDYTEVFEKKHKNHAPLKSNIRKRINTNKTRINATQVTITYHRKITHMYH